MTRDGNTALLLGLAGVGALAYLLFANKASAAAAVLPISPAGSPTPASGPAALSMTSLPGSLAPTAEAIASSSTFWDSLTPTQPVPEGYIDFPSGSQAAAATFGSGLTRMDALGNYYVLWGSEVYELGAQDAQGNWPATLIGAVSS